MVVTASNGFKVKFAAKPAAITTIIVSPIARLVAKSNDPAIPGNAAGRTIFRIVSDWVAPSPKDPSLKDCGTAFITSSDNDEIRGTIIIPITIPAANALSDAISRPKLPPVIRMNGATVRAAKKP